MTEIAFVLILLLFGCCVVIIVLPGLFPAFEGLDASLANAIARIRRSGFVKLAGVLLAVVSVVIAFFTAAAVLVELDNARRDRETRTIGEIERAMSRLMLPAGGNIGKGEALNALVKLDVRIEGLDLSCRQVGLWDAANHRCEKRPEFNDLNLNPAPLEDSIPGPFAAAVRWALRLIGDPSRPSATPEANPRFSFAMPPGWEEGDRVSRPPIRYYSLELAETKLRSLSAENVAVDLDLRDALIGSAYLTDASISGSFDGAALKDIRPFFATLSGTFVGTTIESENLSGTELLIKLDDGDKTRPALPRLGGQPGVWADMPLVLQFITAEAETISEDNRRALDNVRHTFLHQLRYCDPRDRLDIELWPYQIAAIRRDVAPPIGLEDQAHYENYVQAVIRHTEMRLAADASVYDCSTMEFDDARARYPDAYGFLDDVFRETGSGAGS